MQNRNDGARGVPPGEGGWSCESVRDRLPLRVAGTLPQGEEPPIAQHLRHCAACRAEAAFLTRLGEARPEPPATLLPDVLGGIRDLPRRRATDARRTTWALSAAAAAVLALGVGLLWTGDPANDQMWTVALDHPSAAWHGDDWVVAGEPVLEALSDDMLRTLLRELED